MAGRTEHSLLTMVVMALVGVLCGADGRGDLEEIARDREAWLARLVGTAAKRAKAAQNADYLERVLTLGIT